VTDLDEIGPAIERAFASGKPACINVTVSGATVHPLTTMMLGDLSAEDSIVVPYYENIPIPGAR